MRTAKLPPQRRTSPVVVPGKSVHPHRVFHPDENFIDLSFVRACKKKYDLPEPVARWVFDQALRLGLVVLAREQVGFLPGVPSYKIGPIFGEVIYQK